MCSSDLLVDRTLSNSPRAWRRVGTISWNDCWPGMNPTWGIPPCAGSGPDAHIPNVYVYDTVVTQVCPLSHLPTPCVCVSCVGSGSRGTLFPARRHLHMTSLNQQYAVIQHDSGSQTQRLLVSRHHGV